MRAAVPLRVVWLFANEDASQARELLRLAAVLALQGLVDNWSVLDLVPGQAWATEIEARLKSADVVVVLSSPALSSSVFQEWRAALSGHAQILPFILRDGGPSELDRWAALPKGTALLTRIDRDEAMLEVVQALQEMASRRASEPPTASAPHVTGHPGVSINDIFRLNGPPTVTFVPPHGFDLLKLEIRTMGTGLIVEGPSRTGKSTAIRKALEDSSNVRASTRSR